MKCNGIPHQTCPSLLNLRGGCSKTDGSIETHPAPSKSRQRIFFLNSFFALLRPQRHAEIWR